MVFSYPQFGCASLGLFILAPRCGFQTFMVFPYPQFRCASLGLFIVAPRWGFQTFMVFSYSQFGCAPLGVIHCVAPLGFRISCCLPTPNSAALHWGLFIVSPRWGSGYPAAFPPPIPLRSIGGYSLWQPAGVFRLLWCFPTPNSAALHSGLFIVAARWGFQTFMMFSYPQFRCASLGVIHCGSPMGFRISCCLPTPNSAALHWGLFIVVPRWGSGYPAAFLPPIPLRFIEGYSLCHPAGVPDILMPSYPQFRCAPLGVIHCVTPLGFRISCCLPTPNSAALHWGLFIVAARWGSGYPAAFPPPIPLRSIGGYSLWQPAGVPDILLPSHPQFRCASLGVIHCVTPLGFSIASLTL